MSEKVRVGVIGAGAMGRYHCETLARRLPGAALAAVADVNHAAAERAACLSPGAVATADHRALLADPSVQAVVIATPNDTHAALIREAARAGKHVFCEKPVALDLASADAALAEAARQGVKLQIGFQRRFDPAYREARRAIAGGELGAVELIAGTTRDPSPPPVEQLRRSGGLFTDTAIHDLDSVRFLTGLEVVEVFATASTLVLPDGGEGFVDTAVTALRLETGALAVITHSLRAAYGYEVSMEVMGERGKIQVGYERQTAVRRLSAEGVRHDYVGWFLDRFGEAYVAELAHFIDCVANDREPEVTGGDGRAALALALLAQRSHWEGRPLPAGEGG
jgi:myo-inositol 2-dehydrogenase/D-chiro-inositol 1-dehydrogenase